MTEKSKSCLSFVTEKKAKTVYNEREVTGRFKQKYKVGDKAADGSIIKEVIESDWVLVEKDKKGNSYYKCLKCEKVPRIRKDDRKKHTCKKF